MVRKPQGAQRVHESWINGESSAIDDPRSAGHVDRRAGGFDEPVADEHGAALDDGAADCDDPGVANRDGGGRRCGERRRAHEEQCE